MVHVLSPLTGAAVPLASVPDPLFAAGAMGPGIAIAPPERPLEVVAPIDGTLAQVFPHAFVVAADDGLAVLVHLGIDTVGLGGAGFIALAAKGDRVEAGASIVTYDVPAILAAGLSAVVPVVVLERPAEAVAVLVADGAALQPGTALLSA
ncbi:PTS glucose transporter subunit IIA [Rathayibacter sp. VKM Ac-2760]|uniref:PTS sugar transporter subunit IIA n=1 Tax=Rathayibacter sp. VKM Ac-2760 TaxID=2609253 RepID=UPI001316C89B|nr:PTS glucose transporter subunit IIA [Rathayibacter sp. VKM Ac-2760]QHC58173.1 PTS glucose transporter subunit IIA [Rathayibacter sp. VKM Ac-2760]